MVLAEILLDLKETSSKLKNVNKCLDSYIFDSSFNKLYNF